MNIKFRNTIFILTGAAGLLFKRYYTGAYPEFVHSYLGNFSVSFAVYFLVSIYVEKFNIKKYQIAIAALCVVDLFEITNGFGIMGNVFDPFDFAANLAGILIAISLDYLLKLTRKTDK